MFEGNERFRVVRRLGSGGMGVVYEALDRQRQTRVALKTLERFSPELLYHLKQEFRSLRDLVHRNLVGLDELFEEDGHWFFTMELVEGEELCAYLRRVAGARAAARLVARGASLDQASTLTGGGPFPSPDMSTPTGPRPAGAADPGSAGPADFDHIRDVFGQIALGLAAIHDAGKIHRDIKSSNVLVTRDGRAVILDFGLVAEQRDAARAGEGEIVGTIEYMAPEQAISRGAVGPAADWYSVGVMLYEVLAGRRPYEGDVWAVIAAKQQGQPLDPRRLDPACPEDLAALCLELLRPEPARRPQSAEVLRRLGAGAREAAAGAPGVFVGRERELGELRRAFEDVCGGATITALVHGESGIGKSTLIQHFVEAARDEHAGAVILSGECREHEAVPFKAMDGVIDALSRYLSRLPDVAAAELVPRNAALLPAVFPVLGQVRAIALAPPPLHAATDPFQRRKRVFTALRELLCLLTERSRLICVIDDLQWADSDSLLLLGELLRPPDQPRMLLVGSVRAAEEDPPLPRVPGEVRRVHLRRLGPGEAAALTGMLLSRIAPEQQTQSARIVDETGGHPLFIGELVRYAAAGSSAAIPQLALGEAIWARACQLDAAARRVLEVVSVAIAPLSEEVIRAAARLPAGELQRSIASLRAGTLVRAASSSHALLEVYHDHIRQSVVRHLGAGERVDLHGRIAAALETDGAQVQAEMLIHHLQGAGQLDRAASKAVEAAERAQAGLAFERASQLYEIALRLGRWPEARRRELLVELGGSLASAGRGLEAADAYAKAAEGADPMMQLTCRVQEADQLVQSGHLERGAAELLSLFREYNHDVPASHLRIALWITFYRAALLARGLRWIDRPRSEIAPRDLALLSLYKAASRGFILVDPVRAVYFVIRGLHLAMQLGDREFIMYFLMLEAGFRAGEVGQKHAAFLERADALMRRHEDPAFQAYYQMSLGSRIYLSIDRGFEQAFEMLDRSDEALARMASAAWELSAGRTFLIYSLHKMGDFGRLRTYSERFIREAEQRGNAYTRTTLGRLCNVLWLVAGDPGRAREELAAGSWISYSQGYHSQHWFELYARVEIAIYEGSPVDQAFLAQHLKGFKASHLQRVLGYRCDTDWLVGRMALSEAARDPSRRHAARKSIARLRSSRAHYPRVLAAMLGATLAMQEGDREGAAKGFREVIALSEPENLRFLAAAARRRLGALVGGDEGRALAAAGERWMREAGVKDVERMTALASPGLSDPETWTVRSR